MAISASLQIVNQIAAGPNNEGTSITLTSISQVNDDSTWSVPENGTVLQANGAPANLAMGNSSVFLAPKGCGANVNFSYNYLQGGQIYTQTGQIYLEIPAVGEHTLWGHTLPAPAGNPVPANKIPDFNFAIVNTGGNSYKVTISL